MKKSSFALLGAGLLLSACNKSEVLDVPIRAVKVMTVEVNAMTAGFEFAVF